MIRMAKVKKTTLNVDKNMEQQKFTYSVGRNVNWYNLAIFTTAEHVHSLRCRNSISTHMPGKKLHIFICKTCTRIRTCVITSVIIIS